MTTIKNLEDLRDSKLLFDKKLPPFGYILLFFTAFMMVGLIVWSTQAHKTYICHASGTVQSANRTYIMSTYAGSISEITVSEGSYVNEGDLIAHIKSTDIDLQQQQLQDNLAIYQTQLEQYNKLRQSVLDNRNYFSETDPADQQYYYQYENYQSQLAQTRLDTTAYANAGYSEAQIQSMIEQSQAQTEQVYYSTLQNISQQITSIQSQIDSLQSQVDALSTGASDYSIYAPTSGTIHMDTEYKQGMVVGSGSVLATVSSENSDYEIVAYVSLNDRPLIHEGDSCRISINGLSQNVYGTITGTVTSIDSDLTSLDGSTGAYRLRVKPDNTYVVSQSGDMVALINGLSVDVRIEYDKLTYFDYVMDAFGVLVR